MMQHLLGKNMASLLSHDEHPLNRTELIIQEDSEDDLETTENDSVTFKEYFGESDDELNERFYGFEEEYDVMEEDSTDDSGEELETDPVVDPSGHLVS